MSKKQRTWKLAVSGVLALTVIAAGVFTYRYESASYKEQMDELEEQQTAEAEPAYANISQYNEGLKSLCEELKVTFIDNADLVKEEYYADDGIHMAPAYYTEWVNRMAEVAGL